MYYYLDPDDGYSKGPYTWDDLKRLPLKPETHIFFEPRHEWRTLADYVQQMADEARQAVRRAPRPGAQEVARSSEETMVKAPPLRREESRTAAPKPAQKAKPRTERPKPQPPASAERETPKNWIPAPPHPNRKPEPPTWQAPAQPATPALPDANPMGISGMGCFVLALLAALLFMGIMWWVR